VVVLLLQGKLYKGFTRMILQTSQAQWQLGAYNDQWRIADKDNAVILLLPPGLDERQVAEIRRFAMEHEKLGYDEGVETGKQAMLAANSQRMKEMTNKVLLLEHMNSDLSAKMQRFFDSEDDDLAVER
jgi:hypothetical protein